MNLGYSKKTKGYWSAVLTHEREGTPLPRAMAKELLEECDVMDEYVQRIREACEASLTPKKGSNHARTKSQTQRDHSHR